jgi:hypothetical protein
MNKRTAIEMEVKIIVKPVAKLNAAPGFLWRVTCRNVPITSLEAPVKFWTAQFFVRKSIDQIRSAKE